MPLLSPITYIMLSEISQWHEDKHGTILLIGGTSYRVKCRVEAASLVAELVMNLPEMREI